MKKYDRNSFVITQEIKLSLKIKFVQLIAQRQGHYWNNEGNDENFSSIIIFFASFFVICVVHC